MLPPPSTATKSRLHVAIVGGGITGVTLALGLQARGISFTIYERASCLKEIGAGVGFSPNAEATLRAMDPRVHAAYKRVATPNGEDYFQWVDGHRSDEIIYKLYLGQQGFQGCRRSDFLDELVKMIPRDRVHFGKQVEGVEQQEEEGNRRVRLKLGDGSVEEADVVVGCDGIRSRVRQLLLGEDNPASCPSYTNQFCFRALVPMNEARKNLSAHRTSTRFMYNGPDAHIITYPVSMGDWLNVLLVIADANPWATEDGKHTTRGRKEEALDAFKDWHPTARAIVDLLPEEMDKWAIFDMLEHPAPFYSRGTACIAGDAAHAVGPHLGAGAGFGMEDALALSELLEAVARDLECGSGRSGAEMCRVALKVYHDVRYERTQWLAGRTREACDLFQGRQKGVGSDVEKFGEEITWRFHKIWEFDVAGMIKEALEQYEGISKEVKTI
ncbi:hypothetical protein BJ170DRAFT_212217 [Xylariales sp. AK1849]|nr:hypothetical protein BJ170DRAFT_212217 [Xylariales sp. AK1849]